MRIGEHSQLLEVGKLTEIHFLGQLTAHRARHVFVVAETPAGKRPPAALRIECPLPQQHMKC